MEPDPRDDFLGTDFSRKLVIVARTLGLQIELDDVEVVPYLPIGCTEATSAEEFKNILFSSLSEIEARVSEVSSRGKVLKLVGTIESIKGSSAAVSLGLREFGLDDPLARVSGTDNILACYSRLYGTQPLVIQGAGTGPKLTASGVFTDILSATLTQRGSL